MVIILQRAVLAIYWLNHLLLCSFQQHDAVFVESFAVLPTRTRGRTPFSFLLQRGASKKPSADEEGKNKPSPASLNSDDDDDAFGAWVTTNLMQWPLSPKQQQSTTAAAEERNNTAILTQSISRLLNLEMLLNLTTQKKQSVVPLFSSKQTALTNETSSPRRTPSATPNDDEDGDTGNGGVIPFVPSFNWASMINNNNKTSVSLPSSSFVEGWIQRASSSIEDLIQEGVSSIEMVEALYANTNTNTSSTVWLETARRQLESLNNTASYNRLVKERVKETTAFAKNFFQIADRVMLGSLFSPLLLEDFTTVQPASSLVLGQTAALASLSAAVYEDTLPRLQQVEHSLVATNTTNDVRWMVTDTLMDNNNNTTQQQLYRCLTIRGYDASDETVDRERLLRLICTANATAAALFSSRVVGHSQSFLPVHTGLYTIAQALFKDAVQPYLYEWKAPSHKIILTGHSVGGSLSILLFLIMVQNYGLAWCQQNVAHVYTFGSPPVVVLPTTVSSNNKKTSKTLTPDSPYYATAVVDLLQKLVQSYVQPWDPIVRLFSPIDPLYPLVSDTGKDGVTPYANGPPRTLRPLLKPILEAWQGWPRFRDTFRGTGNQTSYSPVGMHYLLLPEPTRYLADRFVAIDVWVPPIESIWQVESGELYAVLETVFPLDTVEISFVPQAIRSFVHHFYPAYWDPLVDHHQAAVRKRKKGASTTMNRTATTIVNGGVKLQARHGTKGKK